MGASNAYDVESYRNGAFTQKYGIAAGWTMLDTIILLNQVIKMFVLSPNGTVRDHYHL
jgi:hypothetical protein